MVLVLVGLATAAGLITVAFYPEPPPPPQRRTIAAPPQKLVEVPMVPDTEPATPESEDAGVDAAPDADATKRPRKRARGPRQGKMDKRRLSAFIRTKQGQVRQCYERRLRQNNLLRGVLVAQIKINPNGRVGALSFPQDTLRDGQVRQCVSRVIQSWTFPEPEGGYAIVASPFRFEPRVE